MDLHTYLTPWTIGGVVAGLVLSVAAFRLGVSTLTPGSLAWLAALAGRSRAGKSASRLSALLVRMKERNKSAGKSRISFNSCLMAQKWLKGRVQCR